MEIFKKKTKKLTIWVAVLAVYLRCFCDISQISAVYCICDILQNLRHGFHLERHICCLHLVNGLVKDFDERTFQTQRHTVWCDSRVARDAIFYIKRCVGDHGLKQHCTIIILLNSNECFKYKLSIVNQLCLVLL